MVKQMKLVAGQVYRTKIKNTDFLVNGTNAIVIANYRFNHWLCDC